jgi:hypothetical protein
VVPRHWVIADADQSRHPHSKDWFAALKAKWKTVVYRLSLSTGLIHSSQAAFRCAGGLQAIFSTDHGSCTVLLLFPVM